MNPLKSVLASFVLSLATTVYAIEPSNHVLNLEKTYLSEMIKTMCFSREGLCEKDEDCGTNHKCCAGECKRVDVCP
jgi:hypothetical protein